MCVLISCAQIYQETYLFSWPISCHFGLTRPTLPSKVPPSQREWQTLLSFSQLASRTLVIKAPGLKESFDTKFQSPNFSPKIVVTKLSHTILVTQFQSQNFIHKILFTKFQSQNVSHTSLVTTLQSLNFSHTILVTHLQSHKFSHKTQSQYFSDTILVTKFQSQNYGHKIVVTKFQSHNFSQKNSQKIQSQNFSRKILVTKCYSLTHTLIKSNFSQSLPTG